MSQIEQHILNLINAENEISSSQIVNNFSKEISLATVKRWLLKLIAENKIIKIGNGKNTRYKISTTYQLINPINISLYFEKEIDQRNIQKQFNLNLLRNELQNISIFNKNELEVLNKSHQHFLDKLKELTKQEWRNEMERLAIDLSWKSSQIEGNTYSLLETEQLLKEKKTPAGKTKEEAIMLLNHKEAIDFIIEKPNYLYPLSVTKIENIHRILLNELVVSKNIRTKRVGISGTNYLPLDNEWQIKEALEQMCLIINKKENIFEKALLAILLISYIQPFIDGNKRTARIVSNSILLNFNYCPLSFRTVDSIDYKKAMLIFYEINNLSAFKKIFIEQYLFAVETYF